MVIFIGKFPALKKSLYTIFDMKKAEAKKRIEQLKSIYKYRDLQPLAIQ